MIRLRLTVEWNEWDCDDEPDELLASIKRGEWDVKDLMMLQDQDEADHKAGLEPDYPIGLLVYLHKV